METKKERWDKFSDAALRGDLAKIRQMVASGEIDPNGKYGYYGARPLMIPAQMEPKPGRTWLGDVIRLLVDLGADVEALDTGGHSVLSYAMEAGNLSTFRTLLDLGADINVQDKNQNNLIHLAALQNPPNKEMVEFLLASGADMDVVNIHGMTAREYLEENFILDGLTVRDRWVQ